MADDGGRRCSWVLWNGSHTVNEEEGIAMASMPIHNETDYLLTDTMRQHHP